MKSNFLTRLGQKPYGCSLYGKRFSDKSRVAAHKGPRSHTGELTCYATPKRALACAALRATQDIICRWPGAAWACLAAPLRK